MKKKLFLVTMLTLLASFMASIAFGGSITANGWYEGKEIYYRTGELLLFPIGIIKGFFPNIMF